MLCVSELPVYLHIRVKVLIEEGAEVSTCSQAEAQDLAPELNTKTFTCVCTAC
jgi:hypothetical protein